jgi:hypothetical protein
MRMLKRTLAGSLAAALLLITTTRAQQRARTACPSTRQATRSTPRSPCARSIPDTGQSGAGVTTRVPFVGRAVPHVRAGVGAVCTQASTRVEYGPQGLDLLAKGVEPAGRCSSSARQTTSSASRARWV